jgi:hypothetical protein
MKKYAVLTPSMTLVNFTNNPTLDNVLSFLYKSWRKHTDSASFQDWANELNEDGNFESTFTCADAIDNLVSEFSLYIDRKPVEASELTQLITSKYLNN